MKRKSLAYLTLLPLLASPLVALSPVANPPPSGPIESPSTETSEDPNDPPDNPVTPEECEKCKESSASGGSDAAAADGSAKTCSISEKSGSILFSMGVGTCSYPSANDFVTTDLGNRQPRSKVYNPPSLDILPFANSLSDRWKGKLTGPVMLSISTEEITDATFTPKAFELPGSKGGDAAILYDPSGNLRQVRSDQYLTDITMPSTGGCLVTTYIRSTTEPLDPDTGFYKTPPTAKKFRTVLVSRPTPTGLDTVDITTTDYSSSETMPKIRVARWVKSGSGNTATWTLSHHTGAPTPENLFASNQLVRQDLGGGLVQRTRTIFNKDSGGNLVVQSSTREKYRDLGNGIQRILEHVDSPGTPEELTTTYTYTDITGTGTVGTAGNITPPAAGGTITRITGARLHSLQRSDGYWELYEYQYNTGAKIMLTQKWTSWKNSAFGDKTNSRHTTITLEKNSRTIIERVAGQMVSSLREVLTVASDGSRSLREERKSGSSGSPLVTEHVYYGAGAGEPNKSRIRSTRHADGTVTRYSYANVADSTNPGQTALKTTIEHGAAGPELFATSATGTVSAPTAGTRTVEITNTFERVIDRKTYDIASGLLLDQATATTVDSVGRPTHIIHDGDPDDFETFTFACCGVKTHRNRDGSLTDYSKDALERPTLTIITLGPKTTTTAYAYDKENIGGRDLPRTTITRTVAAGSNNIASLLVSQNVSNLRGQILISRSPDSNGDGNPEELIYTYDTANRAVGYTGPDGITHTRTSYADGQSHTSISTSGSDPVTPLTTYDYAPHNENGGGIKTTTTISGAGILPSSSRSYTDLAGRTCRTETLGYNGSALVTTVTFDERGRMIGQASTGKPATQRVLNFLGETIELWTDANGDGQFNNSAVGGIKDSVTKTETGYLTEDSTVCQRTRQWVRDDANADILLSTSFRSPDGLYQKFIPLTGPVTVTTGTKSLNGNAASTTKSYLSSNGFLTRSSTVTLNADGTTTAVSVNKDTAGATLSTATQIADLQGRVVSTSDGRTPATINSEFTAVGQPLKTTHGDGTYTVTSLDAASRPVEVKTYDSQNTLISTAHTSYHPSGLPAANWGTNTNPTYKIYDIHGRIVKLRTYRSSNLALAPDVSTPDYDTTIWKYESHTGLLLSKRDEANKGTDYTYTPDGKLLTRTSARGIVTTYGYDSANHLVSTDYSDNTPDVSISFDRLGRQIAVSNGIAKSEFTYDSATLATDTETISYDLNTDGTADITRVLDRSRDALGRDLGWQLKNGGTVESEANYSYGATDGRLETVSDANSAFRYGYLANSSLVETITATTGAVHTVTNKWEPTRNVLAYKQNKVGTTIISQYDYTVNELGQRTNLATKGSAFTNAPSWLWGYDPLGQLISADSNVNTSDRAYQYDAIGNRKKMASGTLTLPTSDNYASNTLNQYTAIPSLGATPVFDDDGNATAYPMPVAPTSNSVLVWDAENRLISTTVNGTTTTTYLYDAQARRIGATTGGNATFYVYDGFNSIAEYSGTTLSKTRFWGLDLSGSMQGAGGVGGLLAEKQGANLYYPTFDGNGNVSEYLRADGSIAAHFEFDPFGNTVVNTDSGNLFNYRFSTKPLDFATGLYYYQYRWYDPLTGRWPSRDPIVEEGGENLYGFVRNDGIDKIDLLGLMLPYEPYFPPPPPLPPVKPKEPENHACDKCIDDPCKAGGVLVRMGSIQLRLQLIQALLDRRHGVPGGRWWNGYGDDSCWNESFDFLGAMTIPECWTCQVKGGSRFVSFNDHYWVECKAKDCAGKTVDSQILDYWSGGDNTFPGGYTGPVYPPHELRPINGPRPRCGPKWRGK